MSLDVATAARQELERHHGALLYADRQKMKRGEFEEVARSLEKRARFRLLIYAGIAAYGHFTGTGLTLFLVMAIASYTDYSHVKRTAATIRRLMASEPAPSA
jgi:hypothetical protein